MTAFLYTSKAFLIALWFGMLMGKRGVNSTIFQAQDNRSLLTTESEKVVSSSTHRPETTLPSSLHHNSDLQLLTPSNQFYPGIYMPRKTAIQLPSDHYSYIYEPASTLGHYSSHYETDHSLQPSPKHFVIVSFIGLLLLFAVIQNTIVSAKRRDALVDVLSSRKKRDLISSRGLDSLTPEQVDIFNDDARVRCIQRTICLQNRKLLRDFGGSGKVLAKYLTHGMKNTLNTSAGWGNLVEDAGIAGLRGEDCNILYRDCI